jgi:phage-related holin
MKHLTVTISNYFDLLCGVFTSTQVSSIIGKIGVLVLAFFVPIQGVLFGVLFLVACDLVSGVIAAKKKREKITSSKMSRSISKLLVYMVTIIITEVINQFMLFGTDVPLANLVTSYIALTELKSILENLDKMTKGKHTAIGTISRALSNERKRKQTPKRINDKKRRKA